MPNPNEVAGALPFDENREKIQIGSTFLTVDATPQVSPLTLPGGGQAIIQVPAGAAEFVVYPVTNDLQVSEDPAMASIDLTPKGANEAYPCATMSTIYLQGTADDLVYFRFTMLGVK